MPDGKTSYLLTDHNGTSERSIDTATQQVSRRNSTPFCGPRGWQPSVSPGEKGFVGGTVDATTGLVHLGAREYDPVIGRFISVDPILDSSYMQQLHGYA